MLASLRFLHYLGAAISGYQEQFDSRMAFDFVGKGMGIKHNSAQNFLREEFQGRRANNSRGGEREEGEEKEP
jgi:hypothetical protein